MRKPLKKIVFISVVFLFLVIVPHALAQNNFVPLAQIPGLTSPDVANSKNLADFFNNLYKYLIGLAAALAVIEIIWGGLEIATKDSVSKKMDGKNRIYQAIFGLVLVLSPVLVFSIINPSILNLGISLSPLPTQPGTGVPGGGGNATSSAAPIIPPTNGCTGRPGQYLETAVCATSNAASIYSCSNGAPLTIPTCSTKNAQGNCVGGIAVYCGKSITVKYYRSTYHIVGHIFSTGAVMPRDAQAQNAFAAGCSADGGVMHANEGALSFIFATPGNCPLDSGIPDYQTSAIRTGYACADEILSCQPN